MSGFWWRRARIVLAALVGLTLLACSDSTSPRSSTAGSSSASAATSDVGAFCAAFGTYFTDSRKQANTPQAVQQLIPTLQSSLRAAAAAAPAEVKADIAQLGTILDDAAGVLAKYQYDIRTAQGQGTADEKAKLNAVSHLPPALLDRVTAYVNGNCTNVSIPTASSKFESVASSISN